jgi:hypothetical protein
MQHLALSVTKQQHKPKPHQRKQRQRNTNRPSSGQHAFWKQDNKQHNWHLDQRRREHHILCKQLDRQHFVRHHVFTSIRLIGNVFYDNNFIDNSQQAVTYGQHSTWDNGVMGNYWSDYAGNDLNHDGIGDTPYTIDANNTDRNPLTKLFAIPEFPQWIILLLLPLIITLAIIIKKKKLRQFLPSP